MRTPKFLGRVVGVVTVDRFASVLQLVALGIGVAIAYYYLGFWPALGAVAVALILISLGIDRSSK